MRYHWLRTEAKLAIVFTDFFLPLFTHSGATAFEFVLSQLVKDYLCNIVFESLLLISVVYAVFCISRPVNKMVKFTKMKDFKFVKK